DTARHGDAGIPFGTQQSLGRAADLAAGAVAGPDHAADGAGPGGEVRVCADVLSRHYRVYSSSLQHRATSDVSSSVGGGSGDWAPPTQGRAAALPCRSWANRQRWPSTSPTSPSAENKVGRQCPRLRYGSASDPFQSARVTGSPPLRLANAGIRE